MLHNTSGRIQKAKKRGKTFVTGGFEPLTHTLVKTPVKEEGLTRRRIRLSKKTWMTFFSNLEDSTLTLTFFMGSLCDQFSNLSKVLYDFKKLWNDFKAIFLFAFWMPPQA